MSSFRPANRREPHDLVFGTSQPIVKAITSHSNALESPNHALQRTAAGRRGFKKGMA
jgi:hypothetical protein